MYNNLKRSIYGFAHINEAVATTGIDPWKEHNRMITGRAHRAFVFYLAVIYNFGGEGVGGKGTKVQNMGKCF